MIPYIAPLDDIHFILKRLIGLDRLRALPGYEGVGDELVEAVLDEAAKIASEVFAPLNQRGDQVGAQLKDDKVLLPEGFREAYEAYVAGGWNGLSVGENHGGQGLPALVAMPVQEMLQSANLGLALCTLLNQGAIELIASHASDAIKAIYLEKMVRGEWSGTMNLTEPDAGSDVGAVKCKATKDGENYRITGQKIFISYGDHNLTDNIIHLVLARLPGAPEGTKGLSLFLVPKILVNPDGSLGEKNDVRVVSLEHKLGQHVSPTCIMAFGDRTGAKGYLVGKEHGGIAAMFTMMNNARIGVGVQGLALMERSYQQAHEFAKTRVQSRAIDDPKGKPVAIIRHPDVKRMLLWMKSHTEAARALAYACAYAVDLGRATTDPALKETAINRADLLTPLVKSWLTDCANEMTSMAIQVHGGMGYIEETGVAQHLRDARVLAIYEGTNGIQGNDLVFRKLARDKGRAFSDLAQEIESFLSKPSLNPDKNTVTIRTQLTKSLGHLKQSVGWVLLQVDKDLAAAAAAASPLLRLMALVMGGYLLAQQNELAGIDLTHNQGDKNFLKAKCHTALFYAQHVLIQTEGLSYVIQEGSSSVVEYNFEG